MFHGIMKSYEYPTTSPCFTVNRNYNGFFFGWVNTHSKPWFRGISWQLFGEKITKWWVKGPPLVTFALQPRHRKPLQELQGDLPARATVASRHGTPKDLDGRVDLQMDWFFSQKNVGYNGYYIVKMFFSVNGYYNISPMIVVVVIISLLYVIVTMKLGQLSFLCWLIVITMILFGYHNHH